MIKHLLTFALLASLSLSGCSCNTVNPGERGVRVSWGKLDGPALGEGLTFNWPGTDVFNVSIRQQKQSIETDCYSSDLQPVKMKVSVLFRVPEENVVSIYRDYHGVPFDTLVLPRINEAIKEATASRSAEQIVKQREQVKKESLEHAKMKIGNTLIVEDIVIENIDLSKEMETAIEQKMVQEQEAEKAKYTKQKAEIDADIAITKAKGEADAELLKATTEAKSITIRGEALSKNPAVLQLELVSRWNGVGPSTVAGQSGVNIMLPAATIPAASKVK